MADLVTQALEALASGSIPRMRRLIETLPPADENPPFRLAIVRTFTIETQVEALDLAFFAQTGRRLASSIADLLAIENELIDSHSRTLSSQPDAILALWRLEDLYPDFVQLAGRMSAQERRHAVKTVADRLEDLIANYARTSSAPLFLSTFPMVDSLLSDATSHYSVPWAIASLNAHIFELAATNANIFVFDFHAWQAANGRASFDDKMTYFARQPIARGAIGSFASAIARTIAPVIRPAAKVLALDLDNVLWGGILGEDGASGVAIGHDFPGNIYFAIQSRARALRDRGTMLALVSKNDLAVVEEAFLSRPEMILHLSDFSAVRVNWLPKHENIASIAKELNIGVESIVFLDDQPFERETVRYHLPEVHVLECSSDALSILSALESTNAFDTLRIGDADLTRIKDYEAQRERRSAAEGTEVSDFLRSLDLRMSIEAITSRTLDRAHQMLQKTNQFNVTTRRHSRADLERLLDDGALGLTITVADRFGDQGIVGLAIATRSGPRAEIDSFLLSCRALGRGAELALWSELIRRLIDHGITEVHATYERTAKNEQVMDLFDRFSMTLESADERRRSYRATLPLDAPFPDWVTRIEAAVNA